MEQRVGMIDLLLRHFVVGGRQVRLPDVSKIKLVLMLVSEKRNGNQSGEKNSRQSHQRLQ